MTTRKSALAAAATRRKMAHGAAVWQQYLDAATNGEVEVKEGSGRPRSAGRCCNVSDMVNGGTKVRMTRIAMDDDDWRRLRALAIMRGVPLAELIGAWLLRCLDEAAAA